MAKTHATHYDTPWGRAPIRPSVQASFHTLSNRELVEAAFQHTQADPEYMAEVMHRNLGHAQSSKESLLTRVAAMESVRGASNPYADSSIRSPFAMAF